MSVEDVSKGSMFVLGMAAAAVLIFALLMAFDAGHEEGVKNCLEHLDVKCQVTP